MKRFMLTFVLAIAAGGWSLNWASGSQISSLCDEWNVLVESFCWPTHSTIKYRLSSDTIINEQRYLKLCEDKVYYNYYGALREGNNRDIYYIPAGSTHEYLLYAFNAQVGDTITNLHIGGMGKEEGYKAVVRSISDSNPRIFTIGVSLSEENEYPITWIEGVGSPKTPYGLAVVPTIPADIGVFNLLCAYKNGEQVYVSERGELYGCEANSVDKTKELLIGEWQVYKEIVKGVNESGEPLHETRTYDVDNDDVHWLFEENIVYDAICSTCYCIPAPYTLVRSNMNITQCILTIEGKYDTQNPSDSSIVGRSPITICNQAENTMEWSFMVYGGNEKPDIYYQYLRRYPYATPTDTIPLFIKDGPGSSTVEPVDPNLIYATLSKDILSIYVLRDLEINMVLYKAPSANHAPAVKRTIKATTFTDSISTTITESGIYTIELTNPTWNYTVVGTFEYQVPQAIENTSANTPSATKILKDGRLFLRYKGQMYNVQGQQVQ